MFYGYENEAEMRKHNPDIANILIENAKRSPFARGTKGKSCVGYFGGLFRYDDGTEDLGEIAVECLAEYDGSVFCWVEEQ